MFKDLMQAIFTEEVEPEEEEVTQAEEPTTPIKQTPVKTQPEPAATFGQPQISATPTYQEPQIAVFGQAKPVEEQPKSTIFTGLDVDSISSEEPRPRKKMYHYDRSKVKKVHRTQEDLEYTPIISPIFGNMEESKKDTSKVHNAIDLNKPEQLEDYMTVISPMYGDRREARPIAQSIPKMTPAAAKETPKAREGYSLDELLEKTEKKENKQETLFSKTDKR